ncbi:MAG TPA: hypothetical protein VLN45_07800 [Ignavibacteriaceae bacterium]|nr:hypothetical protein [Ignavibacteriaceae bacterium]
MPEKPDLFYILLKLRSYLVSLINSPEECDDTFTYTEEFLERRYPDMRDEIITLLTDNGINSDYDIAFNEKIVFKFKDMISETERRTDISTLLKKFDIDAISLERDRKKSESYKNERERELNKVIETLFQLAANWAVHRELENKVDDYSTLSEEDLIRPEEEKSYDTLGKNTNASFDKISKLTEKYINILTDYYFHYGGDLTLIQFVEELENIKVAVFKKYADLFKKHGFEGT